MAVLEEKVASLSRQQNLAQMTAWASLQVLSTSPCIMLPSIRGMSLHGSLRHSALTLRASKIVLCVDLNGLDERENLTKGSSGRFEVQSLYKF